MDINIRYKARKSNSLGFIFVLSSVTSKPCPVIIKHFSVSAAYAINTHAHNHVFVGI